MRKTFTNELYIVFIYKYHILFNYKKEIFPTLNLNVHYLVYLY